MNRICLFVITVVTMCLSLDTSASNVSFADETLHYVISYKWGIIHKDAGEAVLSSRVKNGNYLFTLTARTKPWADKIFNVRDTLRSTVRMEGFQPLKYVKSAHEGGRFARDVISFTYSGNKVAGACSRHREKKGNITNSSLSLSATGPTFDMLSVFYYLRTLPASALAKGAVTRVNIFSGSKSELLTIKGQGEEMVTLRDKSRRKAYRIKFNFTSEGKKKSSDDIDCWISADAHKIPLLLIGTLPVGQVKCYYVK